jgi:hypothetical protein
MTTDTVTDETTTTAHGGSGPLWGRPAGRHRKPRPRRAVLAVGGLALAAGALSLVRLAPESVTGGGGTAEAEPRIDVTDTAATVGSVPSSGAVGPSAAAARGGAGTVPVATDTASPSTRPSSPVPHVTDPATGIPEAPSTPRAFHTPEPGATAPATPAPTPSPSATTHTPAPAPGSPDLCVPLVGLCVNGLAVRGG